MDFVADQLGNGAKFRILTVIDIFRRQALAIEAGSILRREHVVEVLNRLVMLHGAPNTVFVDNGSEFASRLMECGRTTMACGWTSADRANLRTTATRRPSMDRCATSA
jgi:putative transposase